LVKPSAPHLRSRHVCAIEIDVLELSRRIPESPIVDSLAIAFRILPSRSSVKWVVLMIRLRRDGEGYPAADAPATPRASGCTRTGREDTFEPALEDPGKSSVVGPMNASPCPESALLLCDESWASVPDDLHDLERPLPLQQRLAIELLHGTAPAKSMMLFIRSICSSIREACSHECRLAKSGS